MKNKDLDDVIEISKEEMKIQEYISQVTENKTIKKILKDNNLDI